MNARLSLFTFSVLAAVVEPAVAGDPVEPTTVAPITIESAPSRWRFGSGYAPLVGLKTQFSGLGRFNNPLIPPPIGGGVDYNYDNGFVRVDSSDNADGATWNWGYESNGQYNSADGGSIDYSLTNSLADGRADERSDAPTGMEVFTYFDMGAVDIGGLKERGVTWGFRGGLHYARIDVANQDLAYSDLSVMTDRFTLNGTIAPLGPYSGSFGGPGPLINDSPSRSVENRGQALVSGTRGLDVHLTTLNLGTYLEVPVASKFSLLFEAGLSAAIASGTYDFRSQTTVSGLGTQVSSGSDSDTKILLGLYLGVGGNYEINDSWSLQASGRYQFMDDFSLGANGTNAVLSFDSAFLISAGVVYSF